ncbi:unnamed protein product [Medioppia subpectinata]|uniref:C2H2-type domain-containing protein n=1 Tax=Medioppia subpectinata TaxID=1979941 RepID=A0A7R9Q227_9ACAR|nr:unnamed protein product [Medioppia subpectinata]CAG2109886.1 unnamed protein product [Medioppia subpectinata]
MNDLHLGSDVKQEPEDSCVEPIDTEMQTLLNTTSKPSTSQSLQEIINEDMNGKSSEDSIEMPSKQCELKCCLRKSETFIPHFRCQRHWCQFKTSCETDFTQHVKTHLQQHRLSKALSDIKPSAPVVKLLEPIVKKRCQWEGCTYFGPNLSRHCRMRHTRTSQLSHPCHRLDCDKRFATKCALKTHMDSHKKVRAFVCVWPDCGKQLSTKESLNNHMNVHNNVKPYACHWPGCEYRSEYSANVTIHIKNVHMNEKQRCDWPECDYLGFNLNTHKRIHTGQTYPCDWPECGKQFTNKQTLKYHINVHQNVKPYACDWPECEYRSGNRPSLYTHKKHVHTGGPGNHKKNCLPAIGPNVVNSSSLNRRSLTT